MKKSYIASYLDKRENTWEVEIRAINYKEALKEARRAQRDMEGKLWSLRMFRKAEWENSNI